MSELEELIDAINSCGPDLSFPCLLQLEGSEISAEIGFLNQQNLILSMENKALKQRLESLSQEQLIKYSKFIKKKIYSKMERRSPYIYFLSIA